MKPSSRILILGIVIELGLALLAGYLLLQLRTGGLHASTSPADAAATITGVLGTVMGGLAGLLIVVFFVLRSRGR